MRKVFIMSVCAAVLLSGCGTYAGSGAFTGAHFGSILGSAIGGITDGPRGSDVGTILGMAGGAVIGAAIGYTKFGRYECGHCGRKLSTEKKLFAMPQAALNIV